VLGVDEIEVVRIYIKQPHAIFRTVSVYIGFLLERHKRHAYSPISIGDGPSLYTFSQGFEGRSPGPPKMHPYCRIYSYDIRNDSKEYIVARPNIM
jgi:hypothetical protein